MVGGMVSIVARREDGTFQVQVVGTGCERYDRAAVNVVDCDDTRQIKPHDSLWWQGSEVYWTPRDKSRVDVRIPRVGYSYAPTPGLKSASDQQSSGEERSG